MTDGLVMGLVVTVVAFVVIFPAISAWESFEEVPEEVWAQTRLDPTRSFLKRWMQPWRFPTSLLLSLVYILVLWPRLRAAGATHRPPWPWEARRVTFPDEHKPLARRLFLLTAVGVIAIVATIIWWIRAGAP